MGVGAQSRAPCPVDHRIVRDTGQPERQVRQGPSVDAGARPGQCPEEAVKGSGQTDRSKTGAVVLDPLGHCVGAHELRIDGVVSVSVSFGDVRRRSRRPTKDAGRGDQAGKYAGERTRKGSGEIPTDLESVGPDQLRCGRGA